MTIIAVSIMSTRQATPARYTSELVNVSKAAIKATSAPRLLTYNTYPDQHHGRQGQSRRHAGGVFVHRTGHRGNRRDAPMEKRRLECQLDPIVHWQHPVSLLQHGKSHHSFARLSTRIEKRLSQEQKEGYATQCGQGLKVTFLIHLRPIRHAFLAETFSNTYTRTKPASISTTASVTSVLGATLYSIITS